MRIERVAFGALALICILSINIIYVASSRFGAAAETFDSVELELETFEYRRSASDVRFTVAVSNGGANDLQIAGTEYSYVVNGVLAGGGSDLESVMVVEPYMTGQLRLSGRITDNSYVDGLPATEPIGWLVRGRLLIGVDPRLDPTWVGFAFRAETP